MIHRIAAGSLLMCAACAQLEQTPHPAPTEHLLDEDAEARNSSLRKRWMEERHRAAPDVDWRAVEAANAERFQRTRNTLASLEALDAIENPWTERGSNNLAGRSHTARFSPDGQHLYLGSASGGVWRGALDGSSWEPLGDNLYGGAHWIAATQGDQPDDPDILLVATDWGAVHYSLDDGASWHVPTGLPDNVLSVRRILVSSDGLETVYLVGDHWEWVEQWTTPSELYRSDDGGRSFVSVRHMGVDYDGDAWVNRLGNSDLYVLDALGLHHSTDRGQSWTPKGAPAVLGESAELCGSEAGSPRFYAVIHDGGSLPLFRSDDAGASWFQVHTVTDYWKSLDASTMDPDLMLWGGVEAWRTTNGGSSFEKVNGWGEYYASPADKLHADLPGLEVYPDGQGGEWWFLSTDGGLYRSTDGVATVENLSLEGLRISQYYSTATSEANTDHLAAGSQDQGFQWTGTPAPAGTTLLDLEQLISGDYGHLVSGDDTHAYVYSVYPGFALASIGAPDPVLQTISYPANESHTWMPFLAPDPGQPEAFFFCGSHLWRYEKSSTSNSWTAVQWSTFDFEVDDGELLTGVAFSPVDPDRGFAVTNRGRLYWTGDHGITWQPSTSAAPDPHYFYGTAIIASRTDPNVVWVGGSGYSTAPLVRSTDGGLTYQPFDDGLPQTLVYSLAESEDGILFAGTEQTAFRRDPEASSWVEITANLAPAATYWSVEAVDAAGIARFGTYGRGVWDYRIEPDCPYTAYGLGLGGANVLLLSSPTPAVIGTTHAFEVSGGVPSAPGVLGVASAGGYLPFAGGTLLIDAANPVVLGLQADASGFATCFVPVPDKPSLAGQFVFLQAVLYDPTQPASLALSNGLQATLCP